MKTIRATDVAIGLLGFLICTFLAAGLTRALVVKGLGSAELAAWVQAIGATVAIGIAIWVPYQQKLQAVLEGKVRSFHHAMAIVNDLRGRVTYLHQIYAEGNRPLAALTTTSATLLRRYETLYDRDLYAFMPGPIVDRITAMSGSFNGIEASVALRSSQLDNKPHAMLLPHAWPEGVSPFEQLYQNLDDLFTHLEAEANALREHAG